MAKIWQKMIDLDPWDSKLLLGKNYYVHADCIYISYSGGILIYE